MALTFLRGTAPNHKTTAHLSQIFYEDGASYQEFHDEGDYLVTHFIPTKSSFFNPPLHLHLYQTENFEVISGQGTWYLPTRSHSHTMRAGDLPNNLPADVPHRFESTGTEPLITKFKINEANAKVNRKTEERFFRNFFGYLDDCRAQSVSPSIFQLELFLWTVDGPLAMMVPGSESVKWWTSYLVCLVLGVWIGKYLLGYEETYPEYYKEGAK